MTSAHAVPPDDALEPAAHYTDSQPSLVERPLRTLKYGDTFAVLDSNGDIGTLPDSPEGLFMRDTRYLSHFAMTIEGRRALLLGSTLEDDNVSLTVDLTNPEVRDDERVHLPPDIVAIDRTKFLYKSGAYERIGLANYDSRPRRFTVAIRFAADFRDLFEVRGSRRPARGEVQAKVSDPSTVILQYDGLDAISRFTTLAFWPQPSRIETDLAEFSVELAPGATCLIIADAACAEGSSVRPVTFEDAYDANRHGLENLTKGIATIASSNVLFNELVCRATSDIYMLVSQHRARAITRMPAFRGSRPCSAATGSSPR